MTYAMNRSTTFQQMVWTQISTWLWHVLWTDLLRFSKWCGPKYPQVSGKHIYSTSTHNVDTNIHMFMKSHMTTSTQPQQIVFTYISTCCRHSYEQIYPTSTNSMDTNSHMCMTYPVNRSTQPQHMGWTQISTYLWNVLW